MYPGLKEQQIFYSDYSDTNVKDCEENHVMCLEIGRNLADPKKLWSKPVVYSNAKKEITKDWEIVCQ